MSSFPRDHWAADVNIIPAPPDDVWVHPSLEVRDSAIEGRGLFATEPLVAGSVVMVLGGRLVTTAELVALIAAATEYVDTLTVATDVHLVLPTGTAAHYGNHSCEPTMAVAEHYTMVTTRAVVPGEEMTVDYTTISGASSEVVPCHCGASACRGAVPV